MAYFGRRVSFRLISNEEFLSERFGNDLREALYALTSSGPLSSARCVKKRMTAYRFGEAFTGAAPPRLGERMTQREDDWVALPGVFGDDGFVEHSTFQAGRASLRPPPPRPWRDQLFR